MSSSFYDFTATSIQGQDVPLSSFKGKVILVVNVASQCGLTNQYESLEKIFEKYSKKGFTILGFPANNFDSQEPGTNEEILSFCTSHYGVKFPVMAKISVKGDDINPIYKFLTRALSKAISPRGDAFEKNIAEYGYPRTHESDILWNFEKFLINKNGQVIARFNPDVKPDDHLIIQAIENALME